MKGKDDRVTLVEDRWHSGSQALQRDHRVYWINKAFLRDQQWVYWSRENNRVQRLIDDVGKVRLTINKLKPTYRTMLGKLLKNNLRFEVLPADGDDASIRGARVAEHLLEDKRRDCDWEHVRRDELAALLIGGTSAVAIDWDTSAGTRLGETESGRTYGTGECELTALSVIDFVVAPGSKMAEFGRWWIRQIADDPEVVQERYGLEDKPEADASSALSSFQADVMGGGDALGLGGGKPLSSQVLVRTMYERPSRRNAKGRVLTVIAGEVVEDKPWNMPFKNRLNLVVFRDTIIDGQWTGDSVMASAIPLQTEYNEARSSILEHRRRCGNARLWVPDDSLDEDELTDKVGEVITYSPVGNNRPEWASPPPLPNWLVTQPGEISAEMDDILGIHAVSRGQATPGAGAGVSLSILAERDDTPLGVIGSDQAQGWSRVGSLVLEVYAAKATENRKITVYPGEGRRPYTETFSGSMLQGQTRAEVPVDVMTPRSRAAQQAYANALLQMGAFGAPPDMRKYAKMADLPGKEEILEGLQPDADKAQRENEEMARGLAMVPRDFDNHGVHIAEHNAFRKSERYEQLNPPAQHLIDLHVKAHEVVAAEEAASQTAKALVDPALAEAAQGAEPLGSLVPAPLSAQTQGGSPGTLPGPQRQGQAQGVNPSLPTTPANDFGDAGTP